MPARVELASTALLHVRMLMLFDPPSTGDSGKGLRGTASTIDRRQESQKIRRVGVRGLT